LVAPPLDLSVAHPAARSSVIAMGVAMFLTGAASKRYQEGHHGTSPDL
jgi:hypothetical protein